MCDPRDYYFFLSSCKIKNISVSYKHRNTTKTNWIGMNTTVNSTAVSLRSYQCKHCPRKFTTYNTYYSHLKRHGAPRVSCPICQKKFHVKSELYRHSYLTHQMPTIHEESPRVPYSTPPVAETAFEPPPPTRSKLYVEDMF